MGKLDAVHAKVFRAIHVEQHKLAKEDDIFAWAAEQPGVDVAKFKEIYNSFTVDNQVRHATQLQASLRRGRCAFHGRGRPLLHRWHHGWQHADRAASGGTTWWAQTPQGLMHR